MHRRILAKAQARKKKFFLQKQKQTQYESDSDDSLSTDDEESYTEEMVGKLLDNQYLILKYLGRGTFSKVWLSYDTHNDKFFALKVYDNQYNEDAKDEIKMMKQLGEHSHPNVIKYYGYFTYKNTYVLVLELCGQTLHSFITQNPSIEEMKIIIKHILEGVEYFHQRQIIHTDLKAENFLTNRISKDVQETMDWFKEKINYQGLVSQLLGQMLENHYNSMSMEAREALTSNKKKQIRKKIKGKVIKQVIDTLAPKLKQQANEFSQHIYDLDQHPEEGQPLTTQNLEEHNQKEQQQEQQQEDDICEFNFDEQPVITTQEFEQQHTPIEDLRNLRIIITDFGNACSAIDEYDDTIQCRPYRPPENILGNPYHLPSDIWSLGCIFFEFLTDHELFSVDRDVSDKDQAHLALMYSILGKMDRDYALDSENTYELFDNKGRIKKYKNIEYTSLENEIQRYRSDLSEEEIKEFADFLRQMLEYIPRKRATAKMLLKHSLLEE